MVMVHTKEGSVFGLPAWTLLCKASVAHTHYLTTITAVWYMISSLHALLGGISMIAVSLLCVGMEEWCGPTLLHCSAENFLFCLQDDLEIRIMNVKVLVIFITSYIAVMTVLFLTMTHLKIIEKQPISVHLHPEVSIKAPNKTLTLGYNMELTVRMAAVPRLVEFFYCKFIRSAALFWSPNLGNIISLILDEESKADHEFAAQIQQQQHSLGFDFKITYEPLPKDKTVLENEGRGVGYNRQLWSSFFMDLYSDADIIGWMDVDATFSTPVTLENIFKGNKLRVKGKDVLKGSHFSWEHSNMAALGKKMKTHFMIYFPTFIWRDTFTNCRNYIIKYLNVSTFEEAFRIFHHPPRINVSPVTLILIYAYYFEHERYDWHLDVKQSTVKTFKLPLADLSPEVHVTGHDKLYQQQDLLNPFKQGYCVAKRIVDKLPIGCEAFKDTVNFQLFEFQRVRYHHLDTWCKGIKGRSTCSAVIDKHYQNVKKYYKKGWYDLDLNSVLNVEKAAATVNITCPKIFDFP